MSHQKFNRFFAGLLLISGAAAFLLPVRLADRARGKIDVLFSPVASPMRRVAEGVSHRINPVGPNEDLPPDAGAEIDRLRLTVASLSMQLTELRQVNAFRDAAGEVRNFSVPVSVNWGDPAGRDALSLSVSGDDGVTVGMPVAFPGGVVGKVSHASGTVAKVRLMTDRGMRAYAAIGAFERGTFVKKKTPQALVEGIGGGVMKITSLKKKEVDEAKVVVGDWVLLEDREDWPPLLYGMRIGQIEKIDEQAKAMLFAEITVKPRMNLQQLREVLVVTSKETNPTPRLKMVKGK